MSKFIRVGDFKLGREEKKAVNEVLDSGRLSEGDKVWEFERKWADYIGTKYSVAVSSGSGALICLFAGLKNIYGISNGSQIITSPLTYIADTNALVVNNLEPVFVDIDKDKFLITGEAIEEKIRKSKNKKKIRAVLAVDLMGYAVDIEKIKKVCDKYNLLLIEDAAQAHGSIYESGGRCGSKALGAIYSFYIAHNIQAGEMGSVVSNNLEIIKSVKKIKAQGRSCDCLTCTRSEGVCPGIGRLKNEKGDYDPRFTHDLIGYNFKTMEFQAALALTQLAKVKKIIKKRQENVMYLNKRFDKYSQLLQLPIYDEKVSYLAYPIVIKDNRKISRKRLRGELEKNEVETRPLFGCIPTQQPAYEFMKKEYKGKLPVADYVGGNGFYIGCHQYLRKQDLDYVVNVFEKILG